MEWLIGLVGSVVITWILDAVFGSNIQKWIVRQITSLKYKYLEDKPPSGVSLADKAAQLIKQNDFEVALDYAERAIQIDPSNENCYKQKIRALNKLERFNDALATAEKALLLFPNYPYFQSVKGWLHYEKGDLNNAIVFLEKAIVNTKRLDQRSLYFLGKCYQKMARTSEAIRAYSECIKLDQSSKWGRQALERRSYLEINNNKSAR